MRFLPMLLILSGLFQAAIGVNAFGGEGNLLHALVIGNSDYAVGKLKNPRNDAQLIGQALEGLGFDVTFRFDLTHREMDESIAEFGRQVPRNGLAFLYYAGHGLEIDGRNYLIPIDAELTDVASVKYKTVPQGLVLDSLATSSSNMNVLVLDCCRDNPFRSISRGVRSRGLAMPYETIPEGMLIAYATAPGEVAADGLGDHSPFAEAMADALNRRPSRGLLLRDVFFYAGAAVKKSTGQRPWLHIEPSIDDFFLRRPAETVTPEGQLAAIPTAPVATNDKAVAANTSANNKPPRKQPATPNLASQSGNPLADQWVDSEAKEPIQDRLLEQARRFTMNGQLTLAIESYAALIDDSTRPTGVRRMARLGRGAAYLNQGQDDDLGRALIDFQAAGMEGFRRAILRPDVKLEIESAVVAKLQPGQIALVTKSHGEWFWVQSVDDDATVRGWIKPAAFRKQAPSSAQASTKAPDQPTVVGNPKQSPIAKGAVIQLQPMASPVNGTTHHRVVSSGNPSFVPSTPTANPPVRSFQQQTTRVPTTQSNPSFRNSNMTQRSTGTRGGAPAGADPWTRNFFQKHGRAPSIWETPRWESPKEIRSLRARGLVR
ncbi:MAG: caspase family protein [Planctomycetota bacterium]